jgi:hypothetical protein
MSATTPPGTQSANEGGALNLTTGATGTATVNFDASRSSAVNGGTISTWQWMIDGTFASTFAQFSHTFSAGSHTISLVVTDNRNHSSTTAIGTISVTAPGSWTQMSAFPPTVNSREVINFSIGNNGYVGIPCSGFQCDDQFWGYSVLSNTWMPLGNHPGIAYESPSFVIGGNGYIISGNQTWQYSASSDQWTRKADIPGADKRAAFGFSVNGIGYIGGGYYNKCSLWAYNPVSDSWTAKNNIPVLEYGLNDPTLCSIQGITFTIGSTAYVTGTNSYFWAYSPNNDTWASRAYVNAVYGQAFAIGANGYVFNALGALYEYDPAGNRWTALATTFPGTTICYPAGFAIGNNLYLGIGGLVASGTCNLNVVNAWWRFGP